MKKTLVFLALLLSVAATAQVKRINLTLSGNHPLIPCVQSGNAALNSPLSFSGISSSAFNGSITETFEGAAGLNFNGTLDYALSPKFFLSTGLGISYLHYKRSFSVGLPEQEFRSNALIERMGTPIGSFAGDVRNVAGNLDSVEPLVIASPKAGQTSVFYLQLPMLAGTSFLNDRLIIRGGATMSWLITASVYKAEYTSAGIAEVRDTSKDGFSPLLIAGTLNISYALLKRFAIDVTAQQYFTPIYKQDYRVGGNARYTVIGLGISYILPH